MNDLCFFDGNQAFSCRVAGILVRGDQILMQCNGEGKKYMFPGGHVRYGENSAEALAREFREESHMKVQIERFLGWKEYFFEWDHLNIHQICAFYQISVQETMDDAVVTHNWIHDEVSHYRHDSKLAWVNRKELFAQTVYPPQMLGSLHGDMNNGLLI